MSTEEPQIKNTQEEKEEEIKDEKEEEKLIDKKLSELMEMGWTLLEEICPLETCNCPLLKSLDGNKYCVKCEMWQFPGKEKPKQKFTDLVLKAHQELALKETGLAKINKNRFNFNVFAKESLLNSLRAKLAYLSSLLNATYDQNKTHHILQNIELCLKNMKTINESL